MASPHPRVLVVDDIEDIARLSAAMLEVLGCEASFCFSGRAALSAVRARPPDLILLNWMMPDLNGFDVLDVLKARPATARVKAVITSGNPASCFAHRARDAGADGFLEVPFGLPALSAVLAHVLGPAPAEFVVAAGGRVPLSGGRR